MYTFLLIVPLAQRYGPWVLSWAVHLLIALTVACTTDHHYLRIGTAHPMPGLDALVRDVVAKFGATGMAAALEKMDDWNSD